MMVMIGLALVVLSFIGLIVFSIGTEMWSEGMYYGNTTKGVAVFHIGIIILIASSILGFRLFYDAGWKDAEIHMKTGGEGRYVLTTQPDKSSLWEKKR